MSQPTSLEESPAVKTPRLLDRAFWRLRGASRAPGLGGTEIQRAENGFALVAKGEESPRIMVRQGSRDVIWLQIGSETALKYHEGRDDHDLLSHLEKKIWDNWLQETPAE